MFDVAGSLCGISALWSFGADEIGCGEPPGALGRIAIGSLSPTAQSQRPANRSRRVVSTHPPARASVLIERRLSYHTVFIRKALKMCHLRSTKAIAKVATVPESCSLTENCLNRRRDPPTADLARGSWLSCAKQIVGRARAAPQNDPPRRPRLLEPPGEPPGCLERARVFDSKKRPLALFQSLPQPSVH
jgi:hypothetical protein